MSIAGRPLRSFLFAPGNHARRVEKALTLDADAVILRAASRRQRLVSEFRFQR
jgi:hypothetical protein